VTDRANGKGALVYPPGLGALAFGPVKPGQVGESACSVRPVLRRLRLSELLGGEEHRIEVLVIHPLRLCLRLCSTDGSQKARVHREREFFEQNSTTTTVLPVVLVAVIVPAEFE
jgi:hypothetical protein